MKFDEFNNIEVPEEVDVFIKNGVKKAEKVKQKRGIKKCVVAAATLVLCCGILVNDNTCFRFRRNETMCISCKRRSSKVKYRKAYNCRSYSVNFIK